MTGDVGDFDAKHGRLVLLGAPIGDPADASPRISEWLATADVVAAEDTRRLRRLTHDLGVTVSGRVVSYFEGNEAERGPALVEELLAGRTVALITDAGMPSVSDPGYRLVRAAVDAGVLVTAAPGPSAVTTALALSGLPTDRFCFEGFLPRKAGERRTRLTELEAEPRTLVFFEAPHRLAESLADLASAFGDERRAAVCRELTKTYEEVRRGPLQELAGWAKGDVRGEITIVVSGAPVRAADERSPAELAAIVAEREAAGETRKEAIAGLALELAVHKRVVFDAVVASKVTRGRN
jgi:16S rRNA (cytidine1402-2'-O)-methyltransferase